MEDNRIEREKRFIKERIVPRKNYRKVLVMILGAVALGLIFGITAGVTIALSRNLTEEKTATQREKIIIVRDDTTESEESGSQEETLSSAEENRTEAVKEPESEESEVRTTEAAPGEQDILRQAYSKVEGGLVEITVTRSGGTDWFDTAILNRTEQFGVAVAESDDTIFILTAGNTVHNGSDISVYFKGEYASGKYEGADSRTGLGIVSVPKNSFSAGIEVVPLGNSFSVKTTDRAYLAGQPMKVLGAVEAGFVTNVISGVDVVDGYEQILYTDLPRREGGSGVLFNEEGQIIGWVSDYMNESGSTIAAACGISPLKFLIEDLCSGNATAYLGVTCTCVTRTEAAAADITPGLYVNSVEVGSPAYECGIQVGDRLISLNERSLSDSHSLRLRLDDLAAGNRVPVEVERKTPEGAVSLVLWALLEKR